MEARLLHHINQGSAVSSTALPVMEHFYTLQGEGFHQGKAAYFIRLAGCDVGCVWCDVKDSWDASKHPVLNIEDLILTIENNHFQLAGKRKVLRQRAFKFFG